MHIFVLFFFLSISANLFSDTLVLQNPVSIPTTSLQNFSQNKPAVKQLLRLALNLANKQLGYLYGSADPRNGAMDCSGTIYYLLTTVGLKEVPRSSDLQYQWIKENGHLYPVRGNLFISPDFSHLRPGDLLFWNGTYAIKRNINVTHVMIYLGKNKARKHLMIGASNGRTYQGKKIYGVSVFDFVLPDKGSQSHFLGYSCIPHINC